MDIWDVMEIIGNLLLIIGFGVLVGALILGILWVFFFIKLGGLTALRNAWLKAYDEAKQKEEESKKDD